MHDDETITPLKVQRFLKEAKPYDRLVYYVGNLAEERIANKTLAEIAQAAYDAASAGQCSILQKRYGRPEDGAMIYLIERRP